MKRFPGVTVPLTVVTLLSAAVASAGTLLTDASFPNPDPSAVNDVLAEARGWSLCTLLLAAPASVASLLFSRRGSVLGRLVLAGSLAYFVYTYLEFAVSPPFSPLYLVYVTAFACAIPALVMVTASVDVTELPALFGTRVPRRAVVGFGAAVAVLLSLAWLKDIAQRTAAGAFGWPRGAAAVGHVVHALDLGLQVPLAVATAVLLARRRPSGYLVAAVFLVNAVYMAAALAAMVSFGAFSAGQNVFGTAAPFLVLFLVATGVAGLYFRAAIRASGAPGAKPAPSAQVEPAKRPAASR
jgi:hypothetical protein